jgi:hypothetical protein
MVIVPVYSSTRYVEDPAADYEKEMLIKEKIGILKGICL